MAARNIIVGTKECPTRTVFLILSSSDSFNLFSDNWANICLELEINSASIKRWKRNLNLDIDSLKVVVNEMLETWVNEKASKAFLSELISVFNSNGMKSLSELLKTELGCSKKQCKKYCRIPQGLRDFFSEATDTNLAIISTPSSHITSEKIIEKTKNCSFVSIDQFIEELSCDNDFSTGQIYVVTVTRLDEIEDLLEAVESSESVPKLLIISEDKKETIKQKIKANLSIHIDEMEWDDLTAKFKLEKKRKLEGEFGVKYKKLSGVVSGHILVDLINDKKLKLFENNIPRELLVSYYVPRMIIKRAFLNKHKRFQESLSKDVFLFTGIDKTTLEGFVKSKMTTNYSNLPQKLSIADYRYIILDDPTDFANICETTQEAVHVIDFKDGYFQWRKSNKNIETIQKMIIEKHLNEEHFIPEVEFIAELVLNDDMKVVCISGSPGMGKSVLLASIGKQLMERFGSRRIVIFVAIRDLINLMNEVLDLGTIKLGLQTLCCENNLEKETLAAKLDSVDLKVELLLDGFDEIDSERQPFAVKFLKFLQMNYNSTRVWVSTRPHHLQKLENELNIMGYNIQPFTGPDQIQFLTSFWAKNTPRLDKDKLADSSRNCLQYLDFNTRSFKSGKDDPLQIAGIPLQCLLLAEVCKENAVSWCNTTRNFDFKDEDLVKINSVATLYKRFVEHKIQKYEKTYSGSSTLDVSSLYAMHSKLALELIFPHSFPKDLTTPSDVHIEEIVNIGLLQVTSGNSTINSPKFIHRTFAEYFCALFVFEKIHKNDLNYDISNFIFNTFFNTEWELDGYDQYTYYRFINFVPLFFFNCLLYDEENTSLAKITLPTWNISLNKMKGYILACADGNFQNLFCLLEAHPSFTKNAADLFEEKLILQSVEYYNLEMLKMLLDSYEKYSRYTPRLNHDALLVAFYNGDVAKFKYLLKGRWSESNQKMEVDIPFLFYKCINAGFDRKLIDDRDYYEIQLSNRTDMLRLLKETDDKVIQKSFFNPSQSPLLNYMSFTCHFEFIKWGANPLAKDENDNTFLHLMPQLESLFLQYSEELPVLQNLFCLKNSEGWTPLALAFKKKVQFSKECIAKLKELGTNFNEIFKGTPLFILAIQSGNGEHVLRFMLENGVDPSCKNCGEEGREKTFLDFAAEFGNAAAVRLLVEEFQIDVNGSNANLRSPLDYLNLAWISRHGDDTSKKYLQTGRLIWKLGGKYKLTTPKRLLEFAIERRDLEALEFSLETGSDVKKMDDGNTLLHLLVQRWKNANPIKIAVNYGADTAIKNNEGLTALDLVLISNFRIYSIETLQLLKPFKDFKWSKVSSLVTSENLANFLVNCAQYISDDDEFISLLNENLKRESASTDSCLFSLFKRGYWVSPDRFHSVITSLILSGDVGMLFSVSPENNLTVFHYALQNIQGIKLESLNSLRKIPGIDFKIKDQLGRSFLFYAVEGGQTPKFLEMLSGHAGDLKQKDINRRSLLHIAVGTRNCYPEMISFLIEKGLNPNEEDKFGNTPFHLVMVKGYCRIKLVQALVKNGAKLKIKNSLGLTPFDAALETSYRDCSKSSNELDCFQLIWKHKHSDQDPSLLSLKPNRDYLRAFLTHHSMKLTEEQFRYLVKEYLKCVIDENNEERKKSPWHSFIWKGSIENGYKILDSDRFHIVVELIHTHDHGNGDVFADEDENGARPMHHIVEHLRVEERTLKLLQSMAIAMGSTDNNGWSVLFYAVKGENATPRYLQILEKYGGGDFKQVDKSGQNLLHLAVKYNSARNLNVMEFLLDKEKVGLDPNKPDLNGNTPLHMLLKEWANSREVVVRKAKLLIEAGANIHLENSEEETALDLAGHVQQWNSCKEWLLKIFSSVF